MPRFSEPSPLPSDRLRVGECVVEIPSREVHAPNTRRPQRITPKTMGVLLVLVENAGKVVSRDALLAEVWPGTLPTDDVITQAITQLRKAFDEQRGERSATPRYIETIAKNGYRLLAPVEWLGEQRPALDASSSPDPRAPRAVAAEVVPTPAPVAPLPTTPVRLRSLSEFVVVCAVAFALLLGLAVFSLLRPGGPLKPPPEAWVPPSPGPERPYRLITSTPGFELSPTLSPDAAMIAYAASLPGRRGTAILVQTTDQSLPRPLTRPGLGVADRAPAWSPDGREIAFVRVGPGEACQILVVAANGGTERNVGRCVASDLLSFSWTPDGRGLLFGSMATAQGKAGLRVLELASGHWRALRYDAGATDFDHAPRYSPDGRWIVFIRNPQLGDLWRMPAAGGLAEPLTGQNAELRGWDWLPDGRAVVFGRRVDTESRLYRLDLATREQRDLGISDAQSPTVAMKARVMAFVQRRPQFGIYRITRDLALGPDRRERLFASSGRDTQPSIAPDARQLVFNSDRSGRVSLWWADLQQPQSLRIIEGIHPETRRLPEWSWDARWVAVLGRDSRGQFGVYEVVPGSGQVSRLPVPVGDPIQAVYLPDPQRMLIGAGASEGKVRLTLFDRSQTPWRALATIDDVSLAKVDPTRKRVLFTRLSGDGLWQADLDLNPASVRRIDDSAPTRWRYRTWDIAESGGIYYIDQRPDCLASLRQIGGPGPEPPPRCLRDDRLSSTNGFSVSGRANAIFVPMPVDDGADIGFMPLPPEPQTLVPGWLK